MNKKFINIKTIYITLLILFSFSFNYYYANLGVFPIDTFAFFDTGYNILQDRHPFKDIWVTTGPLVDYLQSLFFKLFGLSWSSYVIHSSVLNAFITYFFFKTLVDLNFSELFSFIYALGLGALCYTISGTPFAYIHSYVFSLLTILIFFHCINFKSKKYFFLLPFAMSTAFLSMQNPSTFINFVILTVLLIFFFKKKNRIYCYFFLAGSLSVVIIFILFLFTNEIPLENFIEQYILFPLSMGEYRVTGSEMAHISLSGRFTFRNIIGHFKFINIFLILLFFFSIKDLIKKNISTRNLMINLSLVFIGVLLIFNQLITSNQTYIFSFIPFIAAFLHLYLDKRNFQNTYLKYFILALTIFCVLKYHHVYNEKRKFMDLQNVDLTKAVDANILDPRLKGLKWITPRYSNDPSKEISLLKEAIQKINKDNRNKLVMTEYQFLTLIIEKNLYILNRWYTHDNISYPLDNHKYFAFYKEHINKIITDNNIAVAYTVGDVDFKNFKIYLKNIFFNKFKINELTSINEFINCK